ncbi:MAG TPA: hypothetical protein VM056_04390 [Terriglobales bacterium]|nr:hypothetical protein [Terriglobales bacterium]
MKSTRQILLTTAMTLMAAISAPVQTGYGQGSSSSTSSNADSRIYREGSNWVQETKGTVTASKTLRVTSGTGSVEVRGDAGASQVTFTVRKVVRNSSEDQSRREFGYFNVNAGRKMDMTYIWGGWVGGSRPKNSKLTLEYRISVPKDTELVKVETLGGSVNVYSIKGKAYLQTAGGSISSDDIGGMLSANTLGGSIDVGDIGGEVHLNTAGGSINIRSAGGRIVAITSGGSVQVIKGLQNVKVETAGGSIDVRECIGELQATTAGGTIEIGNVGQGARLETAGGSIRLTSAKGMVRANTAGGGIRLTNLGNGAYAETANGPIEAEFISGRISATHLATTAGDIVVYLPSDAAVTIKAAIELANGHKIVSEFSGVKIMSESGSYGPKEIFAEGSLNGGGPIMKVHTSNGNIYFRKAR